MLPPIIYTPPPVAKKVEPRRGRAQLTSAGSIGETAELDETEDSSAPAAPQPLAAKPALQPRMPIEGADRKPASPRRALSDGTLNVLLGAQEVAR
jgi:hypothetical protein